ncbi:hypothetical protein FXO37_10937 [Capsicum annuum]|nr:hypothetical protein FXO37_10937 [Capsicum annuum]
MSPFLLHQGGSNQGCNAQACIMAATEGFKAQKYSQEAGMILNKFTYMEKFSITKVMSRLLWEFQKSTSSLGVAMLLNCGNALLGWIKIQRIALAWSSELEWIENNVKGRSASTHIFRMVLLHAFTIYGMIGIVGLSGQSVLHRRKWLG